LPFLLFNSETALYQVSSIQETLIYLGISHPSTQVY